MLVSSLMLELHMSGIKGTGLETRESFSVWDDSLGADAWAGEESITTKLDSSVGSAISVSLSDEVSWGIKNNLAFTSWELREGNNSPPSEEPSETMKSMNLATENAR